MEKRLTLRIPAKDTSPRKCHHVILLRELGRGQFGSVSEARGADGKIRAMKMREWKTNGGIPGDILREASILAHLRHPNLLEADEIFLGNCKGELISPVVEHEPLYQGEIQYLLEYLPSTLAKFILDFVVGEVAFRRARMLSIDAMRGLSFLHQHNIVHGDLKPDNILIQLEPATIAKLGDFGSSRFLVEGLKLERFPQSRLHLAPRLLFGNDGKELTFAADVYSLGIVFLTLFVFGLYPFDPLFLPYLRDAMDEHIRQSQPSKIDKWKHLWKGIETSLDLEYEENLFLMLVFMLGHPPFTMEVSLSSFFSDVLDCFPTEGIGLHQFVSLIASSNSHVREHFLEFSLMAKAQQGFSVFSRMVQWTPSVTLSEVQSNAFFGDKKSETKICMKRQPNQPPFLKAIWLRLREPAISLSHQVEQSIFQQSVRLFQKVRLLQRLLPRPSLETLFQTCVLVSLKWLASSKQVEDFFPHGVTAEMAILELFVCQVSQFDFFPFEECPPLRKQKRKRNLHLPIPLSPPFEKSVFERFHSPTLSPSSSPSKTASSFSERLAALRKEAGISRFSVS